MTSDSDGRVYYADGASRIRRQDVIGGAVSDVIGNYSNTSGFVLLPNTGCLIVATTQSIRKVV